MGDGMRGIQGTRKMFTRIRADLLEDSGEFYYCNIPGNVPGDSGECSRRYQRMLKKNPRNVPEDSGEC